MAAPKTLELRKIRPTKYGARKRGDHRILADGTTYWVAPDGSWRKIPTLGGGRST